MNELRNKKLTENSRTLRKGMTPEERHLWYDFLKDLSVNVHRQKILGRYIVDFYCKEAKLVIEIDGAQHYEHRAKEYDGKRTEYLENLGMKVIRILNGQVNKDFSNVCRYINENIDKRG
ncbi:MAG: endonuclease domain-containing protein [Oscillospiraceae bacterium]|nr:endonuclease domain-containing protein [Oscillospiraceae bacterium]MBR3962701.1 endonuclease domain-containing protein [Oscillospiraceae bacterium]